MADCLYQYTSSAIAAANREVTRILQARNPKVRCSKKQGAYRKCSAEERAMFKETMIGLCSISWQVFCRDADRISIVNVGTVPLAIQFVIDAWGPHSLYTKFPLKQLEIIAATGNRSRFLCLPSLPSSSLTRKLF